MQLPTPSALRAEQPKREIRPINMDAANKLMPGQVIQRKNVTEIVAYSDVGDGTDWGVKRKVTFFRFPTHIFAKHFGVKTGETLNIVFPDICNDKTLAEAILSLTAGLGLKYRYVRGSSNDDFNSSKRYVALGDFNGQILTARCVNDDMDGEQYRVKIHGKPGSIIVNNVYPVRHPRILQYEHDDGSCGTLSAEFNSLIGREPFSYKKALAALTQLEKKQNSRSNFIQAVNDSHQVEITLLKKDSKDQELSPTTLKIVISSGKIVYLYEYERWGEASIERETELVDKRKLFQLCKIFGLRDDDIIDHLKRALKRKLSE